MTRRRGALDILSPALGPGQARRCPRTLALEAAGRGRPGRVGREGSQVWSWGGARSRRKQNVEFSRHQTWERRRESTAHHRYRVSWGESPKDGSADLLPRLPSPKSKGAPAPLTFLERKGSVRLHPTHWCQMDSPRRLL